MDLYQKIETVLGRNVDFTSEVKLESKNIFKGEQFIGFEEFIKEWNAPEPKPSEAELDAITEYKNPREAELVRAERDRLIAETDWTQVTDVQLSDDKKEAYKLYRQALRDVPEQDGFPYKIDWPEKP